MGLPILRIRLFGTLDLRYGEDPLRLRESARAESLLAYLLIHREAPQPRQHLAFLLWPDSTEPQARTNLRHVLHNLRRALPESGQFLDIQPRTLQWRTDAPFWLDIAAFDECLARSRPALPGAAAGGGLSGLREAVELYTEDLLTTCYDEWLLAERERLRQGFLAALNQLVAKLTALGEHGQAILYAERLLRHDPLHEETYRRLMRLYDASGDRARALRTYYACATTLERELSIEPSALTRELYEALLPVEPEIAATQPAAERGPDLSLVGRAAERSQLTALWRAAEGRRSHLVLVTGEPGVGKTRLVEDFRVWCAHRGAVTAEARSYAAEGALVYGPVIAWLRSDAIVARLERLDPVHRAEVARLLPELRTNVRDFAEPDPLTDREQRQRLFDALAQALLAPGGALLLVADDLQWCDRETLQFLHYLLRSAPGARVLVVATARREALDPQHPLYELIAGLQALERFTEIPLERLTREETVVLARRLVAAPLAVPELDQLYGETEGNPLFVVEALRSGWKPGQAERGPTSPKIKAVIDSRLAQLSSQARELVSVAATIGRAFSSDLLANASEADEDTVVRSLDELWRRHILREQGSDAYDFSHDKIREIAYQGLSPAVRRHYHLQVAAALERLHAGDAAPVSAQLAAHYERAGRNDEAITWYQRAAETAQQLHANLEAIRLLDRALGLLHALPEDSERQARELAILTALPAPMVVVEGYRSSRLSELQQRALELTRALAIEPEPPLLRSLAVASLAQGDFDLARGLGERIWARGERDADDMLLVEAGYVLGIAAFWSAEFQAARTHFQAAVQRYRPEQRRVHLLRYGQDPKVVCLSRLGNTLWFLGQTDAALLARDAAVALAGEIGHPHSTYVALVFAAMLALEFHDLERFRAFAARAAEVGSEQAAHHQISIEGFSGYLDVLDGRAPAGIARIQRALDEARGILPLPGIDANLVRLLLAACEAAGDAQAGLAAAERALSMTGAARVWEAEAHRVRAESLAALGGAASAVEAEYDGALQAARCQGAPALALRAALSLVRYRAQRGDGPGTREAHQRLAAILAEFPAGQDTPELRAASAVLARR